MSAQSAQFEFAEDAALTQPLYADVAVDIPVPGRFSYGVPAEFASQAIVGALVRVPFGRRRLLGIVRRLSQEKPSYKRIRNVLEFLPAAYCLPSELLELCDWVSAYYGCSEGEALALALPPRPGTKARSFSFLNSGEEPTQPLKLTDEQAVAVSRVAGCIAPSRYGSFVLHGVTGSGKTEVYLQLIEQALASGQRALVLLPEIALTPQTLRRLAARFPGRVLPYHSRLSQGERCATWEAAQRGEVDIVVGARSAAFVPLKNLGLIVVDEEHEPSYKADDRPRHHARDVVVVRAQKLGIPILLGSATPSLESFANARAGKHELLRLDQRVGGGEMPDVEIVDRRIREKGERIGSLTPRLSELLEETLERGEQAIIFHNRRGFARYLQCFECGDVSECPNCDISLTYHLSDDRLHCHYCGIRLPLPSECPACKSSVIRPKGTGTQRVEVALEGRFPEARILRLDQDTTSKKDGHGEILRRFGKGEAEILLGTQMVAKGLHFPNVSLVGVIDADAGLHFPDFRAHERAFQLLTQVAGRSGRTSRGRVVLQSFDPEHRVLQSVLDHRVVEFLEEELSQRKLLGYPPERRLVSITATAPDEALLDRALAELKARLLEDLAGSDVILLGPARAAIGRIKRRFRGQILIKGGLGPEGKRRVEARFSSVREAIPGSSKLELHMDVDALNLL